MIASVSPTSILVGEPLLIRGSHFGSSQGAGRVTIGGVDAGTVYHWTGPFGTASGPTPTVTLPFGVHVITLTVSDGQGGTHTDTVVVTIADTPPVFTFVPPAITITSCQRPDIGQARATAACGATVTNNARRRCSR